MRLNSKLTEPRLFKLLLKPIGGPGPRLKANSSYPIIKAFLRMNNAFGNKYINNTKDRFTYMKFTVSRPRSVRIIISAEHNPH